MRNNGSSDRWRRWARWLRACGLPDAHVAAIVDVDVETIAVYLATRVPKRISSRPAAPPFRWIAGNPHYRPILAQTGNHMRTLRELGYDDDTIAIYVAIAPSRIADFFARLEPLRRPRRNPDRLVRPRGHREERQARRTIELAQNRRRDHDQVVDEHRERLRLHRSPVDGWGLRGYSAEIADYARLQEAIRSGRLSGTALLELASRVHYAEPRTPSAPPIEPAIWTGETDLHVTGPVKLTGSQILEAAELLRSGMSWKAVARRLGVSENTLRRYVTGVAPRRAFGQKSILPTEPEKRPHGTVRWDLPLGTTTDGTHRTVVVECRCGRQRRVWTKQVTSAQSKLTGMCEACYRASFRRGFADRSTNHLAVDTLPAHWLTATPLLWSPGKAEAGPSMAQARGAAVHGG